MKLSTPTPPHQSNDPSFHTTYPPNHPKIFGSLIPSIWYSELREVKRKGRPWRRPLLLHATMTTSAITPVASVRRAARRAPLTLATHALARVSASPMSVKPAFTRVNTSFTRASELTCSQSGTAVASVSDGIHARQCVTDAREATNLIPVT